MVDSAMVLVVRNCTNVFRRNTGERPGKRQNGAPNASRNGKGNGSGEAGANRRPPSRRSVLEERHRGCRDKVGLLGERRCHSGIWRSFREWSKSHPLCRA